MFSIGSCRVPLSPGLIRRGPRLWDFSASFDNSARAVEEFTCTRLRIASGIPRRVFRDSLSFLGFHRQRVRETVLSPVLSQRGQDLLGINSASRLCSSRYLRLRSIFGISERASRATSVSAETSLRDTRKRRFRAALQRSDCYFMNRPRAT
jgi:hypothetical protein